MQSGNKKAHHFCFKVFVWYKIKAFEMNNDFVQDPRIAIKN